jgi:hypothetical protein
MHAGLVFFFLNELSALGTSRHSNYSMKVYMNWIICWFVPLAKKKNDPWPSSLERTCVGSHLSNFFLIRERDTTNSYLY